MERVLRILPAEQIKDENPWGLYTKKRRYTAFKSDNILHEVSVLRWENR